MRLPPRVGRTPQPALLVCPDCGGALAVQTQGDAAFLLFVCQVGHSYSATTLLAAKEERLEEVLWSAVYLIEELAGVLSDLAARGGPNGDRTDWPSARRRIERLHDHAARLRQLLDGNERIDLGAGAAAGLDSP